MTERDWLLKEPTVTSVRRREPNTGEPYYLVGLKPGTNKGLYPKTVDGLRAKYQYAHDGVKA